ncbi:MAG: mechanosensitive ion channel [Gemmatimonadaceae bacterium]|nr:mechanosensitive ion channel [Gemmatimonadaceae bacterium]NUQ94466.1 mechanosensitive ion channel [Gemmatimonadaceae bacterium]NUR18562.1 mechanosensitive ion channel [Gemmatimonadaceae bacterium]NUS97867.1 mechanosensitive ion channel [Gemmatimonadaceae bacterium]
MTVPTALLLQEGVHVFGVKLAGFSPLTGRKLLVTLGFVAALLVASYLLRFLLRVVLRDAAQGRAAFWSRQAVKVLTAVVLVVGLVSIWFDDPGRIATAAGLITAGIAVALQRVITSFAAFLIILRGRVYTVGDRITMAGVRGDVVAVGFMQTTVMEMGEPPSVQEGAEPAVWVQARQYTGRLVRMTNDKIFDSPVYNYTREFPYLWEEIHLPIRYQDDRAKVEQILLDAARKHTQRFLAPATEALGELRKRYTLPEEVTLEPAVYWRLTDNWLELNLRFIVPERGIRGIKDAMSRDILAALDAAKIGLASATYDIVGFPPIRIEDARR